MDNAIKDIIDKTLELEGLLLLAQSRAGSELEASVNRLVILKKEEVAKLIDAAFGGEPKCDVEPQPIVMPIVEAATVEEIAETIEPEENFIAEPVEESIEKSVEEPSEEPEPLENFISEPIEMPVEPPVSDIFDDSHLEPIEEPQPIDVPTPEDKPIFDDTPLDEEDAPLDEEYEDDEEEDDDEVLDDDDEALTLDEALQRSMSRDLRKAFSLNDRFRYRRELFGNSDVEMNDTLNLVETMHSYSEAEEFFYGDLEWDSESPEVKDFMAVIRNHFYNKEQ
ncbi:MAG: hypothetical protein ACI31B_01055 [Muribaculaceae bacterium]